MTDNTSVRNEGITSDERIRNALKRHIRRALDSHAFTRESLHEESGVNLCQIDQIMAGSDAKHRRVTCEDAFNLAYTLGDRAVSALIGCMHYTARRADAAEETRLGEVVATGLQHFSTIATAAADGRIDHTEAPACQDAADQLIATVLPFSSAGKAA